MLEERLARLPDSPGVYQMLDADGAVLYIGKAISLRNRVRSYFQRSVEHHPRTTAMVARVADVETVVVSNEVEALILEANLIKRHQPPFNVRLRDDKRYPYLKVTNEPFPRVHFTRTVKNDGARYFGPYTDARALRSLMDIVRVVFPLRTCREPIDGKRKRPCLQYHIKRCLAPCVGFQSADEYDAIVDDVILLLEGKQEALLARLHAEMDENAARFAYEGAARIRDRILAVRRIAEKQKVVWATRLDMDLIAIDRAQGQACAQVFLVREGKLIGQEHFILDGVGSQSDGELLSDALKQFYLARIASVPEATTASPLELRPLLDQQSPTPARPRTKPTSARSIPKEILVQVDITDRGPLEAWLSSLKGQRVRILHAQRGPRAEYLRLVHTNAQKNLGDFLAHQEVQESAHANALTELAEALELPGPPHRIECYDISNIQGTNAVASMVVFLEGRPKKSEYRKFKIQYDQGPNDFAMMQETLRRRLRYLAHANHPGAELAKKERFNKRPDLLLIDGGKGQLQAVVEVLDELGLAGIPVAGLAKEHEWLYLPGDSEPTVLVPSSAGLHLVMRLRDEAHRFAITFHRTRRAKAMLRTRLDALEGIGPTRRKRLVEAFGTAAAVRRASVDDIAAIKGFTLQIATKVKRELESDS